MKIDYQKATGTFLIYCLVLLVIAGMLQGCATPSGKREEKKIQKVPYQTFDLMALTGAGIPEVEVRLATQTEIGKVFPNSFFQGVLIGGGFGAGAAAVIATGMILPFGPGAVAGCIVLLPAFIISGAKNQIDKDKIIEAINEADLPGRIRKAILRRLAAGLTPEARSDVRIEVLILGYGFINDDHSEQLCFSFDAETVVRESTRILYSERVYLSPYKRSIDAPPPRCSSLEEFATDAGKLVQGTLSDAGEIIAAMIIGRLRGKP